MHFLVYPSNKISGPFSILLESMGQCVLHIPMSNRSQCDASHDEIRVEAVRMFPV